jgi:hypothetical protein
MWLVLATPQDDSALWAASRLRARLSPLLVLTPSLLLRARAWRHALGVDGVHTELVLADGTLVSSRTLRGVVNRIAGLSPELVAGAVESDRLYALQEVHALLASWLAALPCPVLNRPNGRGLNGPWCGAAEWTAMALRAGLPAPACTRSSGSATPWAQPPGPGTHLAGRLHVIADRTLWCGAADRDGAVESLAPGCIALARFAGVDLLCCEFTQAADGALWFAGASTAPDLRLGGELLLDEIAAVLGASKASAVALNGADSLGPG